MKTILISSLIILFIGITSCQKQNDLIPNKDSNQFINIGEVVYNSSSNLYYNNKGKLIDLDSIKKTLKPNQFLEVSSLSIISDEGIDNSPNDINNIPNRKRTANTAKNAHTQGYIVNIDNHIWWGADNLDNGGDIGISTSAKAFIFRPGELYMRHAKFKFASGSNNDGAVWARNFLWALYQADPTDTVILSDFKGPAMTFPFT
ncbi:hypothetical protein [Sphingobacterium spiritivorum]|uniref:Uncharacterized protein n=1 Tax=Sphingobacterium spiritivorum ATCC 33861 TaxID=525373 RepID=D7VQF0_SPHSI|nr:hypothetical protein [Sphingobacterium spiritivorum]EFK56001.1 hypothetical protein HMPREF0766_13204 [Sphingobacterium spiritivorum ATCC 33861]QQT35866.1 hypothetical protein I6J01_00130 [Sphingobacterium spiritivorum]WQD32593.1 hypothetical protein U0038_13830 [Sphingobacterium spiritivorum]SUJ11358.1 Uncharacterised protein [Sphingobacterium spiritivorum]